MNWVEIGVQLCVKYVAPKLKQILKSAISNLGKSLYERLFNRFKSALESFEAALKKMFETDDPKKLKKRLTCCCLGFEFFKKIHKVLDEVLPEYSAAVAEAEVKYEKISGEEFTPPVLDDEE